MIAIKNGQELEAMRQACKITAAARALAGEMGYWAFSHDVRQGDRGRTPGERD